MEHLSVTHGTVRSSVTCNGCGVVWELPAGPMVAHLDRFAQLHMRCEVTHRRIDVTEREPARY
jgi:hypothetical protein